MEVDTLITLEGVLAFMALVFIGWAGLIAWRWREAAKLSREVYKVKRDAGELKPHVKEEAFHAGYMRAERPRAMGYFFLGAVASAVSIPPLMGVFTRAWYEIWTLTGRHPPAAEGTLIHTFSLFVFSMLVMIAILWFTMRRYHTHPQPDLRDVVRELNGDTK
ncbi:MAG: hypothetical protein GVY06_11370 [Alphaproteobacteria bacterium]|jgi:HAMP domain-containing protein|nr:hypothetical protein [Alphaproteobacteria bacterium]